MAVMLYGWQSNHRCGTVWHRTGRLTQTVVLFPSMYGHMTAYDTASPRNPLEQEKQQAQLMLTNPRDAFRCQLRSPNMVPYYHSTCSV